MTSFNYQGSGVSDFGWIVPLPAVPDKVEEGGGWTLQRLNRATHPQPAFFATRNAPPGSPADTAEVLQQVQVRALDITVIRGSGQAIEDWCKANSFLLSPETRAHLLVYAKGSPIFMAAKYNIARAQATRQLVGDGAPVLITMHVPHPWVPLEVLANGVSQVNADLYLLTDAPVYTSPLGAITGESPQGSFVEGAPGFALLYQQRLDDRLFKDLSSDKNMGWVRPGSVLTYLSLQAPATSVTYDLGVSSSGVIKVAAYGTHPMDVAEGSSHHAPAPQPDQENGVTLPPGARTLALWLAAVAVIATALYLSARANRRRGHLQTHS
jgi:hypothetical protein